MREQVYLLAVVGCVGHAHQILVGPAVQVGVLPADDAVARVAGLALAAEHGVTVMAQVVALGVTVAVVGPIRARVAGFAHLRGQHPDVNAEPSSVSRYGRNKNPDPCHLRTDRLQGEGCGSLLSFPPTPSPTLTLTPWVSRLQVNITLCVFPEIAQHHCSGFTTNSLVLILKAGLCIHPSRFFCEGDAMTFLPFLAVPAEGTLRYADPQSGPLYLFVGGGLLHAPAEGLRAGEAWRAGQAVVAGVCVLAPVLSIVAEAGVRHQGALWEK